MLYSKFHKLIKDEKSWLPFFWRFIPSSERKSHEGQQSEKMLTVSIHPVVREKTPPAVGEDHMEDPEPDPFSRLILQVLRRRWYSFSFPAALLGL